MKTAQVLPRTAAQREKLVAAAIERVRKLDYAPRTIQRFCGTWHSFLKFACRSRRPLDVLADEFLEKWEAGWSRLPPFSGAQVNRRTCMKMLLDLAAPGHNRLHRRQGEVRLELPRVFDDVVRSYETFCAEHLRLRRSHVLAKRRVVSRLLTFCADEGMKSISEMDGALLSGFVRVQPGKPKTMAAVVYHLRGFCRFLTMRGLCEADLSAQVPRVRVRPDDTIRSVWKATDVEALLKAVDRSTAIGKRDYAILLLAARLGLRPSDFRTLRLEDIKWDEMLLKKRQVKTGRDLVLPLPVEVGNAIIDYLKDGRPKTNHREVFLRAMAPYEPLRTNGKRMLQKYIKRAGISFPQGVETGFRSLRHTVASRLLQTGADMETIAGVLGHVSTSTTWLYTKVDIEALRTVALDPEALGGHHA